MTRSHSWFRPIVFVIAIAANAIGARTVSAAPQEGVKVHGEWTVVVRNEDGSIASRNEFKNALVQVGAGNIASVLGAGQSIGTWLIYFEGGGICTLQPNQCFISTSRYGQPAILSSTNLTVTVGSGADYGKLTLTGSLRAVGAGSIARVATMIMPCPAANPTCSSQTFSDFSIRVLTTPIAVVAGQTVDISVVFSFS